MKTAISVPDEIFEKARRLAHRMKKSRSRLFSEALREYVARHSPEEVTEAVNATLDEVGEGVDPFVSAATRHIMERSEW